MCGRAGVITLKSVDLSQSMAIATHGLQQILFISHITGSLWTLGNLENRQ